MRRREPGCLSTRDQLTPDVEGFEEKGGNTSDGGGELGSGVAAEHLHNVIWWGRGRVWVCWVEQHAQWLRRCGGLGDVTL